MRVSAIILLVATIFMTSCRYFGGERVYGNQNVVTRDINVGSFNKVTAAGSMKIRVAQGPANAVQVQTDENLLEYIDIYTEGDELTIRNKRGYNVIPSKDLIITVTAPDYKAIEVAGSGEVMSVNNITSNSELLLKIAGSGDMNLQLTAQKVNATIAGSGGLQLQGSAPELDVSISGSGNLHSFGLVTDNALVELAGSASAEVFANKSLDIRVAGSGSVQYKGNPSVKQKVAGSGSIEKVG